LELDEMNQRHGRRSVNCPFRGAALLLVVPLLILGAPLSGQVTGTVTGTVTDLERGLQISGAQVQVVGTVLSSGTDPSGAYRIGNLSPGEVEIRVQRLGFAQATRTVTIPPAGGTVTADFSLPTSPFALDALVVTATGTQRRRELGCP
jgi:hypothetical protein